MKLSFVIPCYKSEETVSSVILEIHNIMKERQGLNYEIITVNDSSPDNVLSILKGLATKDKNIKIIDLAKNVGKHAAIMAGYSVVDGDIIINLDDDGQCPLDKLWELISPLSEGYDISIARYPKKIQSAFKNFGSKVNTIMTQILVGKPKSLYLSNFSALKRFAVDEIVRYQNPYPYVDGLFIRTTSRICNVDMDERKRTAGIGNYTFIKSLRLWLNGFTAFSVLPLRVATLLGVLLAVVGLIFGITIIVRKILNPDILVGYSSTMAVLLLIGGMIMLMLGMIGEYIGRIYICINNSPQYVIRETVNINECNVRNEKE